MANVKSRPPSVWTTVRPAQRARLLTVVEGLVLASTIVGFPLPNSLDGFHRPSLRKENRLFILGCWYLGGILGEKGLLHLTGLRKNIVRGCERENIKTASQLWYFLSEARNRALKCLDIHLLSTANLLLVCAPFLTRMTEY